jgi:hypothetical protein
MFRLIRLKPPHGWNAVAWELGIVTLGVLVALAARREVTDELNSDLMSIVLRQSIIEIELSRYEAALSAGRLALLSGEEQYRMGAIAKRISRSNEWQFAERVPWGRLRALRFGATRLLRRLSDLLPPNSGARFRDKPCLVSPTVQPSYPISIRCGH